MKKCFDLERHRSVDHRFPLQAVTLVFCSLIWLLSPAQLNAQNDPIAAGIDPKANQLTWRKDYKRRDWIGGTGKVNESILELEKQIGRTTKEGADLHEQWNRNNAVPSTLPKGTSRNHKLAESDLAGLMIHVHANIYAESQRSGESSDKVKEMKGSVDNLLRALTGKGSKRLEPDLSSPTFTKTVRLYETDRGNELYKTAKEEFDNSLKGDDLANRDSLFVAVRHAAQGPPNLRFGNSITNSTIRDHFDANEVGGRKTPISDGIQEAVHELGTSGAAHPDMVSHCIKPFVEEELAMFSSSMALLSGTLAKFPDEYLEGLDTIEGRDRSDKSANVKKRRHDEVSKDEQTPHSEPSPKPPKRNRVDPL